MKVKNPVSQNIRIFPKINQKRICKTELIFLYFFHTHANKRLPEDKENVSGYACNHGSPRGNETLRP